jgi:hypothetical protein
MQATEIDVAFVHHVEGARLDRQMVEDRHIVRFPVSYADKTGDVAPQVDERMELDGSLAATESRPGKQRQAQVDRCGVQRIGRVLQRHGEAVLGVQRPGTTDEHLGEVGPDAPVAVLVGVGQSASRYLATKASVIELGPESPQASLDVPQALAIRQLREGHRKELIATRELAHASIAAVSPHARVEFVPWEEFHHLSEHHLS